MTTEKKSASDQEAGTCFEYDPAKEGTRGVQFDDGAVDVADKKESARGVGIGQDRKAYENLGATPAARVFEPPDQRLMRLQAEVADLLDTAQRAAQAAAMAKSHGIASDAGNGEDVFKADPSGIADELKMLDTRLSCLAREGLPAFRSEASSVGPLAMSGALVSQIDRVASGGASAPGNIGGGDGRVTYELTYAPSHTSVADSGKITALEASLAEVEKQLGLQETGCAFAADMMTTVGQVEERVAQLESQKLEAISRRVQTIMADVDATLAKKAELEGTTDHALDQKVNELYEFSHRWTAASASLPGLLTRLRSLQGLHQQSANFASRLAALEQQQDELAKLLETTNTAVQDLGKGLQENMTTVKDSMKTLEEKVAKALRS